MLSLLYLASGEMQHLEVSNVLRTLLRSTGLNSSEADHLAASLQRSRSHASASQCSPVAGQRPLLLFVDSEIAQFPLEACPFLQSLEVVRGLASNVSLAAFKRQRSGHKSKLNATSAAPDP